MSDDQNVGYRRPPTHTRFRSGVSGNPSGRPKRRPTFRAVLLDELAAPTAAGGAEPTVSKLQALVRTLVAAAISGDARAQALLLAAITRIGEADEEESVSLSPDDREILDAYVGNELERRAADSRAVLPTPKPEPNEGD
jgi:Family of unknown function (DUF5681)